MAYDGSLIFDTKIDNKGFKKGVDGLASIGKGSISAVNTILKGTAVAVAGIGAASIKMGSDFESGMSRVLALTGASEAEFKKLNDLAKQLGRDTVFSASQASEGMQNLATAGFDVNEIVGAMPGLLDIAAAGQTDLGTASDITASILRGFGIDAENTGKVADILTKTFTSSNTTLESLGDTMKYVAPVAKAAGFSLEETAAAAGILGDKGIVGSQAGTTLRGAMLRLINPPKQAAEALDKLGVSVTDSGGKMKPLHEIIGELDKATEGMTDQQRSAIIAQIAGQNAVSGLLGLMDAGADTLKEFGDELKESGGAAAEIAAIQLDNLKGDIDLLKSAIEGAGIALYEHMQAPLRSVTQTATGYISTIAEAIEANKSFEEVATIIGEILADVVTRISNKLPELLEMGGSLILSFLQGIKDNKDTLMSNVTSIVSELLQTYMAIIPEMLILGIEMITSLIQGIVEEMPSLIKQAQDMVMDISQSVVDNLPLILQAGIDILLSIIEGIAEMLPDLITLAIDLVIHIADTLIDNIDLIVEAGMKILLAVIQGLLDNLPKLIESVPRIINSFTDAIFAQFPLILSTAVKIILEIIKGLISAIPTLVKNIPQIIRAIVNVFTLYNFAQIGKAAITKIGQGISGMAGNIGNIAKNLANKVIQGFKSILNGGGVKTIGTNLVKGIWNGISNVTSWILSKIKGFGSSVMKGIKGIFGIKSPSQLMRDEVGKNLALGIGVGFEAETDDVSKDINKEMEDLANDMQATVAMETSSTGRGIVGKGKGSGISEIHNNDNGVTQNVTIVNPENTPAENARELRKVGRDLALGY